jgi:hypothetical protein
MRKLIPLILVLFAFNDPTQAQCDATFTATVNGATVQFVSDTTHPGWLHQWKFGDGSQGFGSATSHTYSNTGIYHVVHIVSDSLNTCRDSVIKTVTVNVPATCDAEFLAKKDTIDPDKHLFVSTSTAPGGSVSSYNWTVNGSFASSAASFSLALPQGTNTVCLTIQTTTGCSSSTCDTIVVDTSSDCNLNSSFTASVAGHIVQFTASDSTPTRLHTWKFGDGTQVTAATHKVLHAYAAPGTYTVTHILKDTANNCVDSSKIYVLISAPVSCTASFVAMQDSVASGTYHFWSTSTAPGASIVSYHWTLNGVFVSAASGFTKSLPQGTNTVCLTILSSQGCSSSTCDSIVVDSANDCNLDAAFTKTVNNNMVNVSASNLTAHLLHRYKFGDGGQWFGPVGTHTYQNAGTYTITHYLTDSVNHCVDSSKQTVTVNLAPTCRASYQYRRDSVNKNKYHFTSTSTSTSGTIQSYQWTINGHVVSTAPSFSHNLKKGPNVLTLAIVTTTGCTHSLLDSIWTDSLGVSDIPGVVNSFPNPASGANVNIDLVLNAQAKVKVTVYSLRGIPVFSEEKNYAAGFVRLAIPTHRLQRGQYFVDIQYNNTRKRSIFQKL